MFKTENSRKLFWLGGVLLVAGLLRAATQTPGDSAQFGSTSESMPDYEAQMRADSIATATTDSLHALASDAYKDLKFIQYDGVTEAELYPKVISTFYKTLAAYDAPKSTDTDHTRFRGVLLDLTDLLKRGAAYYSSAGNAQEMTRFAKAYVDLRRDPRMKGMTFGQDAAIYPSLVYCTASDAYNKGNFDEAAGYLEEYLNTGTSDRRQQVMLYYGQACVNSGQPERCVDKIVAATELYPADFNLLTLALQACLDSGMTERMQPLLTRALSLRPEDEMLLNAQGRLFEDEGNYSAALGIYQQLYELKPQSKPVNQHLALCYYNLGAEYYNKALMESDEKAAKRCSRQSQAYLQSAVSKLETVVENDPTNAKYLRALAMCYGCLGDAQHLEGVNVRLQALGLSPMAMNAMPESIAFAEKANNSSDSGKAVPDFQEFARTYVEKGLADWTKRGEFEKSEDFEKRVSKENVLEKYQALCKLAEGEYLKKYASKLRISDLSLSPYDSDNESYLINSEMGRMVVKVPLKNKEAEAFKSGWSAIQLRQPKFYIKDNRVAIASVDFVTPAGKTYSFNADNAADYDFTEVRVDLNSYLASNESHNSSASSSGKSGSKKVIRAKSDVDVNIPITNRKAEKTIALVIGNEDYRQVSVVESALNDAETFANYCSSTLGIPESQVMLVENATLGEMLGSITRLRQLANALGDGVDIIVYYAGHGFPDERDKDAYLLPIDGDGVTPATAYPLKKLYADLGSLGADNVLVFLDACFSGAARNGDMLAHARGIALKPKEAAPEGNMFVLSAASDQQTAMPYKEKNHGLFTYFLLKKIQETKGNVTLRDLSRYVEDEVKKNSMTVNKKMQTPRTTLSGKIQQTWTEKKLRK